MALADKKRSHVGDRLSGGGACADGAAGSNREVKSVGRSDHFILFQHCSGEWCAAPPGFRNLLRDPIGRGETPVEAVRELLGHHEFVELARKGEWASYVGFGAFVEVPEPDSVTYAERRPGSGGSQYRAAQRRQLFRVVVSQGS
jgi:hypothetical protein